MSDFSAFDNALRSLESIPLARVAGRLVRLNGILLESVGCPLMTGQLCRIESANHTLIDAQAVGFNRDITYLMPFKQPVGLMAGARVFPEEKAHDILIGESWLGRVVNGLGEPLDGKGRLKRQRPSAAAATLGQSLNPPFSGRTAGRGRESD